MYYIKSNYLYIFYFSNKLNIMKIDLFIYIYIYRYNLNINIVKKILQFNIQLLSFFEYNQRLYYIIIHTI